MPPIRQTYDVDETANRVLHSTWTQLGTASILGGTIKIEKYEVETQYTVVDPSLPPFPLTKKVNYRGRFFGTGTGDRSISTIYSDYRQVKCYDDRFAVKIGEPTLSELISDDR